MQRIINLSRVILIAILCTALFVGCVNGQLGTSYSKEYKNGMVVTASPLATEVGLNILKKGGNSVDAAVAVQFALAVV